MAGAVKEVVMSAELEPEVKAVENEEDNGRSAGQEEDRAFRVFAIARIEDVVKLQERRCVSSTEIDQYRKIEDLWGWEERKQ